MLLCYIYCAMMCNAGSFAMLQCCADVQWFAMLLCNVCNAAAQCFAMLTLCSAVLHGVAVLELLACFPFLNCGPAVRQVAKFFRPEGVRPVAKRIVQLHGLGWTATTDLA